MASANINVNNPSVVRFISEMNQTITNNVPVDGYFGLIQDKKIGVQYIVYKLIKTTSEARVKLTEEQFKSLFIAILTKNEDSENYEIAAILSDILNNYDSIVEMSNPAPKRKRRASMVKTKPKED